MLTEFKSGDRRDSSTRNAVTGENAAVLINDYDIVLDCTDNYLHGR